MIEITASAEDLLVQLRGKHGYDQTDGVRFEAEAGKIRFSFARLAKPDDRVVAGTRIPIFVAPELADTFREVKIDAEQADGKQKIVVTRKRAAGDGDASQT